MWAIRDSRTKEFGIFKMRDYFVKWDESDTSVWPLFAPPTSSVLLSPPKPFEECLLYLLKDVASTKKCRNPDCPAPYFFAASKKQRFCGLDCARVGQRLYKRRWWKAKASDQRRKTRAGRVGVVAKRP